MLVGLATAGQSASVGATADDDDKSAIGASADDYIDDLIAHVVGWDDQLVQLEQLDPLRLDLTDDEKDLVVELAGALYDAPGVARQHQPPAGLEALQTSFETVADGYAAVALAINAWFQAPVDSPAEAAAEAAYHDAFDALVDPFNELVALVDAAIGGIEGDSSYLTAATALADSWGLSLSAWYRIDPLGRTEAFTDEEVNEYIEILMSWVDTPTAAAELEAPAEYATVHAALTALADGYATVSEAVFTWSDTAEGSAEETTAAAAIDAALATVDQRIANFNTAVAAATGGAEVELDCDAPADYLDCVAALATAWNDDLEELGRIDPTHSALTTADAPALQQLLDSLGAAPEMAASLPVPAGLESVGASFTELAVTFAMVPDAVFGWAGETQGSAAEAEFAAQLDTLYAQLPAQTEIFLIAVDITAATLAADAA